MIFIVKKLNQVDYLPETGLWTAVWAAGVVAALELEVTDTVGGKERKDCFLAKEISKK
jgi:hypothetical protein